MNAFDVKLVELIPQVLRDGAEAVNGEFGEGAFPVMAQILLRVFVHHPAVREALPPEMQAPWDLIIEAVDEDNPLEFEEHWKRAHQFTMQALRARQQGPTRATPHKTVDLDFD